MHRRKFLALGASTALVTVAGCGGVGEENNSPETAVDTTVGTTVETTHENEEPSESASEVRMQQISFDPMRLSVEPGTEVTWTNDDSASHTISSETFHDAATDWSFESDTIDPGGSVSFTFEESGVYEYVCTVHGESNMCGVVLVGDASLDEQLPCEASESGGDGGDSN